MFARTAPLSFLRGRSRGISFVGAKLFKEAGATGTIAVSLTDLLDSSGAAAVLQPNDFIILSRSVGVASDRDLSPATPTNWDERTPAGGLFFNGSSFDSNLSIWTRHMGATPDTSVTIDRSGNAADALAMTVHAFRGVSRVSPLDVAIQTATGGGVNPNNPNAPSVSPVTPGTWVFVTGAGAVGTGTVLTAPATLSNGTNHYQADFSADTNDAVIASGFYTGWVSGAYDPAAFTNGTGNTLGGWCAASMALRPA